MQFKFHFNFIIFFAFGFTFTFNRIEIFQTFIYESACCTFQKPAVFFGVT